jgi:prepilin-type processing-associated H-X9-DG protein
LGQRRHRLVLPGDDPELPLEGNQSRGIANDPAGRELEQSLAFIGQAGVSEGQRFGGNGGIAPFRAGRFGLVNCELPYERHRDGGFGSGVQPHGRANFAFGDGHVECLSDDILVNQTTGLTSGKCVWYAGDPP